MKGKEYMAKNGILERQNLQFDKNKDLDDSF